MKRYLVLICLAAAPVFAQSGLTGNWSGHYTFSVTLAACSNKTFTAADAITASLLQTGTSVTGRIDLKNLLTISSSCVAGTAEATDVVVGSVSGAAVTLVVPNNANGTQFDGTFDGAALTLAWSDAAGASGTITLTRTTGDAPAVDTTGSWAGNYSFTDQCSNGKTIAYSGAMTLTGVQPGSPYSGVATLKAVPVYDQTCSRLSTLDMSMVAAGSMFGSTLSGAVWDASGSFEFPFSVSTDGSSMSGTVAGANGTSTAGTFTLTRNSNDVPATDLAGTYEGSYSEVDDVSATCLNIGRLSFSGDASLSVVQAGSSVSGWLTFHDEIGVQSDGFGNCATVGIGDQVLPFYGTLTGSTLVIQTLFGSTLIQLNTTFAANNATGSLGSSASLAQFTVTRPATATPGPRRRAARP